MHQSGPPVQVTAVDFAVPPTIGPRFPAWADAVEYARGSIQRATYPGQVIRPDAPEYHPRRYFQEGPVLVVYSRAFVHMRVTEPIQQRAAGGPAGTDGVAATWEVFLDGTVENLPRPVRVVDAEPGGPARTGPDMADRLASVFYDLGQCSPSFPLDETEIPGGAQASQATIARWLRAGT